MRVAVNNARAAVGRGQVVRARYSEGNGHVDADSQSLGANIPRYRYRVIGQRDVKVGREARRKRVLMNLGVVIELQVRKILRQLDSVAGQV